MLIPDHGGLQYAAHADLSPPYADVDLPGTSGLHAAAAQLPAACQPAIWPQPGAVQPCMRSGFWVSLALKLCIHYKR